MYTTDRHTTNSVWCDTSDTESASNDLPYRSVQFTRALNADPRYAAIILHDRIGAPQQVGYRFMIGHNIGDTIRTIHQSKADYPNIGAAISAAEEFFAQYKLASP